MGSITVHKLNWRGEPVLQYQADVAERLAGGIRLEAQWTRPELDLGYTSFETGDHFIEWFFADRWYNIFEVRAAGSERLKGWYCNVAAPAAIDRETVACRDLLLDVWVAADGTSQVLDTDEFAAEAAMEATIRANAEAGLADLLAEVHARRPPFDAISGTSNESGFQRLLPEQ
jgi:uncharacterized protein